MKDYILPSSFLGAVISATAALAVGLPELFQEHERPAEVEPDLERSRFWVVAQRGPMSPIVVLSYSPIRSVAAHVGRFCLAALSLHWVSILDRERDEISPLDLRESA